MVLLYALCLQICGMNIDANSDITVASIAKVRDNGNKDEESEEMSEEFEGEVEGTDGSELETEE